MRKLNKLAALTLCIVFCVVLAVFASAATLDEMRENGEVSDGDVRFGDIRDGIVSDVSEGGEIFTGEGTGMPGDILGEGNRTNSRGMNRSGDTNSSGAPSQTGMPDSNTSGGNSSGGSSSGGADATGEDGGMGTGILIAVLVVVAVVVIIFLLMPKRRG